MPILPEGSVITLTNSVGPVTSNVVVTSIKYKTYRRHFERAEFMHERLLGAPNADGSKPTIQTLAGNRPIQYLSPCNPDDTMRLLTPDDDDLDDIYKRFDIQQWQCEGGISLAAEVDEIFVMARAHQVFLGRFDAHQTISRGNVSYTFLTTTLQPEDFDYLTDTTISVYGNVFGLAPLATIDDILITDFTSDYANEEPTQYPSVAGTSIVYSRWSMVFEKWNLVPARSLIY